MVVSNRSRRRFSPFNEEDEDDEDMTRGKELMSILGQLQGRTTTRGLAPINPSTMANTPTGGGNRWGNQLNEIAKWGQYSQKPKTVPSNRMAAGRRMVGGNSSFDRFMRAIAAQESGGRYGAVNRSSGAMGKYQIMPFNIRGGRRGWDYEVLGRDISTSQFMRNPQLQEQIARAKLQGYYRRYGARGAAEAWYGGPGSIGRGYVRGYSNSILRRMGLR
jgi:hypothetical protein